MVKLSIVIPTLNEEKYLPGLLQSIKVQTFKDFEIIVADAGSKDKTVEIAKSQGCKVVPGGLPAEGRNAGAKVAQGDLILFLDADTKLPTKNFLKKALREFQDRKLGIASCRHLPLEKKSKYLSPKTIKALFDFVNLLMITFEKIMPFGSGSMILVKKALHQKIKGFPENIRLGEDNVYIKRAAQYGKFGTLRQVKILYSIRRWEKEKWLKPMILWIMFWFLRGFNEKTLDIFKKGPFEYRFGHYEEEESLRKDLRDLKKKIKKHFKRNYPKKK